MNLVVDCRCPDTVGQEFCAEFKNKVTASPGYRIASDTSGYGIGVHFSCVDLWQGIDAQMVGKMSAVSVTFTVYAQRLPGEVYEDSEVFRVGKDATSEMSEKVVGAIGQIISTNATVFEHIRQAAHQPSPSPSP